MKLTLTGLSIMLALSVPATAQEADTAALKKGQALLTANCSRCHAIGSDGKSTHEKAPPFRDVIGRYPAENLAEALAEGIVSGHPDMPEFTFKPDEIDAIIGYLNSLKSPTKN